MKKGIPVFWMLLALTGAIVFGTLLASCDDTANQEDDNPSPNDNPDPSAVLNKDGAKTLYSNLVKMGAVKGVIDFDETNATLTVKKDIILEQTSQISGGGNIHGFLSEGADGNGTDDMLTTIHVNKLTITYGVIFKVDAGVTVDIGEGVTVIVEKERVSNSTKYLPAAFVLNGASGAKAPGKLVVKGTLTVEGQLKVNKSAEINVIAGGVYQTQTTASGSNDGKITIESDGKVVVEGDNYPIGGSEYTVVKPGAHAFLNKTTELFGGTAPVFAFDSGNDNSFLFNKISYLLEGGVTLNGAGEVGKEKKSFTVVAGQTMTIYGKLAIPAGVTLDVKGAVRLVKKEDGTNDVTFTNAAITGSATLDAANKKAMIAGVGSELTVTGTVEVIGNAELVIGAGVNKVTFTNASITGGMADDEVKTIFDGAGGNVTIASTYSGFSGTVKVIGTAELVIGETSTVKFTNATITNGRADGAAGKLTLVEGNSIELANGGTIVVAGDDTKVDMPNTEFRAGTYTATGEIEIKALTAGDTIKTDENANSKLSLGTLTLGNNSTNAATYTFKKSGSNDKVTLANNSITTPASSTAAENSGANLLADANGKILIGDGSIALERKASGNGAGFLTFAAGAKIGTFSTQTGTKMPATVGIADADNNNAKEVTVASGNTNGVITALDVSIYGATGGDANNRYATISKTTTLEP